MATLSSFPKAELNPFSRVEDVKSLTPESVLTRFEETGFLWFQLMTEDGDQEKLSSSSSSSSSIKNTNVLLPKAKKLINAIQNHPQACQTNWTIENRGTLKCEKDLTPSTLLEQSNQSFYASTIVHLKENAAFKELNTLLPNEQLEPIFEDLHITSGLWLFLGHHPAPTTERTSPSQAAATATATDSEGHTSKRLKVGTMEVSPMIGRAEHVDEVTYAGTFHIQISGTKTWYVRPHPDLFLETNPHLPDLSNVPGAERSPKTGAWRLKVEVQQGDVFVLNTKIWYHYTELPQNTQQEEWSISVARDFYLPIPCPKAVAKGEIIFEEDQVPDDIPQTETPNCALVEIGGDDEDEEEGEESKIVLVALEDIQQGQLLSIAHEDGDDQGAECNANEMIDPRAIAKVDWEQGQVVLQGDDIPDELPRSLEPNCELHVTDDDQVELRASEYIACGNIFSILPDKDEEYEQVEVDLTTGELLDRE